MCAPRPRTGNSRSAPRPSCWDELHNMNSCESSLRQVWKHRGQPVNPGTRGTTKASRWGESGILQECFFFLIHSVTTFPWFKIKGIFLALSDERSYARHTTIWMVSHQARSILRVPQSLQTYTESAKKKNIYRPFSSFGEKQILRPSGYWIFYNEQGSTFALSSAHNTH